VVEPNKVADFMGGHRLQVLHRIAAVRTRGNTAIRREANSARLGIEENVSPDNLSAAGGGYRERKRPIIIVEAGIAGTEADQVDAVLRCRQGVERGRSQRT